MKDPKALEQRAREVGKTIRNLGAPFGPEEAYVVGYKDGMQDYKEKLNKACDWLNELIEEHYSDHSEEYRSHLVKQLENIKSNVYYIHKR